MADTKQDQVVETPAALPAVLGDYTIMQIAKEQIQDIIDANIGGQTFTEFDLERLSVPTGGGTNWEVANLDGTSSMVPTIDGVIVHWKLARGYWEIPYEESGGGVPPDCQSQDSVIGVGTPGGDCRDCALAKFGSAPGRKDNEFGKGQACKQMRVVFLMRPQSILPTVVSFPPTSLKGISSYLLRLTSNLTPFDAVVTRLSLEEDKNTTGVKYSKIIPSMVSQLGKDEHAKLKAYMGNILPAIQSVTIMPDQPTDS